MSESAAQTAAPMEGALNPSLRNEPKHRSRRQVPIQRTASDLQQIRGDFIDWLVESRTDGMPERRRQWTERYIREHPDWALKTMLRRPGDLPFPSRPMGQPQPDLAPELSGIDHIIVIMMENHSFDNYFGMLQHRVPHKSDVDGFRELGPDGVPTDVQVDDQGRRWRAFPMPTPMQQPMQPKQNWDASHLAYNNGAMDGFLKGSTEVAMGYWDEKTLPLYYDLASRFTVCDRWFASTMTQTIPNRAFLMSGTSAGGVDTLRPVPPVEHPPHGHIWNELEKAGITWGDVFTTLPTTAIYGRFWAMRRLHSHMHGPTFSDHLTAMKIKRMARTGRLPSVLLVEPAYHRSSEENPQNIQAGQAFVGGVLKALISVPEVWRRSLMVLTYDEHGGWYDHVAPPRAVPPGDSLDPTVGDRRDYGDRFNRYGFRVPTVVMGPWVKPGHTSKVIYDHTSILSTIARKWNLPYLTYRDANANDLRDCLVDPTRTAAPFADPPHLAEAPRPGRDTNRWDAAEMNWGSELPPAQPQAAPATRPS